MMDKKEQTRLRVKRYREKQRSVTGTPNNVTQSPNSVTKTADNVTHPVLKYLIPGPDRDKMERIVESVKRHNQLRNVYLGCGVHSLSLDIVGEMLEVT